MNLELFKLLNKTRQGGLSTLDIKFTILGGDIFGIKFRVYMCQYLKG